jgi:tetratricopeptide (TPR) repeat protein
MRPKIHAALIGATVVLGLAVIGCKPDWSEYDKQFQQKIDECTKAIRLNPNDAEAFYNRGIAYCGGQTYWSGCDYDKAIADFTEAIRLNPKFAKAYHYRGLVYQFKRETDKGIADYTEAIRLDPKFVEAYYSRSEAYANKSDHDKEVADLTEVIRLAPRHIMAHQARGLAYLGKKDYDEAIADCTAIIRREPSADRYYFRALASRGKGDVDTAIADCTEAIKRDSKFTGAYETRAAIYSDKGETSKAEADLSEIKKSKRGERNLKANRPTRRRQTERRIMGTVYEETFAKPLPEGARIIVRKGQRLAQGQDTNGTADRCRE